jgi:hypothetical protein
MKFSVIVAAPNRASSPVAAALQPLFAPLPGAVAAEIHAVLADIPQITGNVRPITGDLGRSAEPAIAAKHPQVLSNVEPVPKKVTAIGAKVPTREPAWETTKEAGSAEATAEPASDVGSAEATAAGASISPSIRVSRDHCHTQSDGGESDSRLAGHEFPPFGGQGNEIAFNVRYRSVSSPRNFKGNRDFVIIDVLKTSLGFGRGAKRPIWCSHRPCLRPHRHQTL